MFTPDQARDFLGWYDGGGEEPPRIPDQQPPGWLVDRHPWINPNANPERNLIPISDYDIKNRTDEEPDSDEYILGTQAADDLVEDWRGTVDGDGFDAIAWYVPFHYSMEHYGIYVTEDGLQRLGNLLYIWSHGRAKPERYDMTFTVSGGDTPIEADTEDIVPEYDHDPIESIQAALDLALEILLRHEWYHHQTELLATYLEDLADEMVYKDYMEQAYRPTHSEEDCIEESLANAYVARSRACMGRSPSADAFRTLFEYSTCYQPEAYREYGRFTGQDFRLGGRHLARLLQTADPTDISESIGNPRRQTHLGTRHPLDMSIHRAITARRMPVYIIQPRSPTPHLEHFKYVTLETDYEVIPTPDFEKKYEKADGDVRKRVDNAIGKLERNVELPGLRWKSCSNGLQYVRVNDQMRMIVDRDDSIDEIELIDFDTDHDLPKKYGCYN